MCRWGRFHEDSIGISRFLWILGIATFFAACPLTAQVDGRQLVRNVEFEGNDYLDDFTLAISIATSESGWWVRTWLVRSLPFGPFGTKRYLNETELRRDVLRILLLYRRSGFFESQVDTLVTRSDGIVSVKFSITEGEPVRVSSVQVQGLEDVIPTAQIESILPLKVGDPFDRLRMLISGDSILSILREQGRPYAQVFRNFDEDRPARTARVMYEVLPGPHVTIDSISVIGANRVDERVVRRVLRIEPGDAFSQSALTRSQVELYRLGLHDFVDVSLADTLPPDNGSGVVVNVQVSEAPLHRLRGGGGGGTFDCLRTLASWSVGNFLGGGRIFDVSARLSKIGTAQIPACETDDRGSGRDDLNYSVTSSLRFPYVFSSRTSGALTIVGERRSEFNAYVRTSLGGSASLTRQTSLDIPVTVSYSLSGGNTRADAATSCAVLNVCRPEDFNRLQLTRVQSTLGLQLLRDRSNSPIDPTQGTRATIELRAATVSNPRAQFFKGIAEFASYHPVGRSGVFAWRVRASMTFAADFDIVPIEERFYLGGANSVRGFRQNELGPVVYAAASEEVTRPPGDVGGIFVQDSIDNLRPDVSPIGGDRAYVANIEYRHPLPVFSGRLVGAIFVDAGQILSPAAETDGDLGDLRFTPGAGIRLLTPLGPMRVDLAYNGYDVLVGRLFVERETDLVRYPFPFPPEANRRLLTRLRFSFSVGQAF